MKNDENEILKQVTLLGILKKRPDETLEEVMHMLVDTGMYTLKEAKKIFKTLKNEKYLVEGQLSLKGITAAKEAEAIFKQ
jgi:polyhydroxyalkanoate synthesis regulator phasin